jgi:hypothetical protein
MPPMVADHQECRHRFAISGRTDEDRNATAINARDDHVFRAPPVVISTQAA